MTAEWRGLELADIRAVLESMDAGLFAHPVVVVDISLPAEATQSGRDVHWRLKVRRRDGRLHATLVR